MIVAPFPIVSGAADIALLMISSSVIFPEGIYCAVEQLPTQKRGRLNTPMSAQRVA
jgi:hypothetical protein